MSLSIFESEEICAFSGASLMSYLEVSFLSEIYNVYLKINQRYISIVLIFSLLVIVVYLCLNSI